VLWGAILAGALLHAAAAAAMPTHAPAMKTGGLTSQPIGHYEFCHRKPEECSIRPIEQGALVVTPAVWRLVEEVNRQVNAAVRPMSDFEVYGREEWWAYPVNGVGDCEDYALEKRKRLAEAGISLSNLLITVLRKADGEGHAVLTLRTDRGDFILDNLKPDIRPWTQTNYRFLKRQASNHTGQWVTLHEDRNLLVGALR
jgi:predicted transglutaminase-like cysteine proteinase